MALEGSLKELLEEIKYRRKFPPREIAARTKSELTVQGLGQSGALITQVSRLYADAAESVLDEFTEAVIVKGATLGVGTDEDLRRVVAQAHEQLFNEARGLALDELKGQSGDYQELAMGIVDERRWPVLEHLQRRIVLRTVMEPANVGGKITVNISKSTIASLNLGTVLGGIQATVNALDEAGQRALAEALKRLAESVVEARTIPDGERREAVELIATIGDEVVRPEQERRASVLRSLASRVRQIVQPASEIAGLYEGLKIAIRLATGIELP